MADFQSLEGLGGDEGFAAKQHTSGGVPDLKISRTGTGRSTRCERNLPIEEFEDLIQKRGDLMRISVEFLDKIPKVLTLELSGQSYDQESDTHPYNPTKSEITDAAYNLCRRQVRSLLTSQEFDSKFGHIWRIPLGITEGEPPPKEFVDIFALGIRTLIRTKGKTPAQSKDFEYEWPTKRYEPTLKELISEASHIGPESWQMGAFLFGKDLLPQTLYYLALHEGCENACLVREHREREQREQGQLVFAATAGSLEARKSLQIELTRDFNFVGLGTALSAEVLSEKIPYRLGKVLMPLQKGPEYAEYEDFASKLIEDSADRFPEFPKLPTKARDRAFGLGAIEFGRFYRQIRKAHTLILSAASSKRPENAEAIRHISGANDFLVDTACGILQSVIVDKANNAVSMIRYLGDAYLRDRVDNDISLARASIVAQSGRILLAVNTIKDCIKLCPEDTKKSLGNACNLLQDLLYTAVEVTVNPVLRENGERAITSQDVFSAYHRIVKPLQNKVEQLYGEDVDSRVKDVLQEALSGSLFIVLMFGQNDTYIRHRPIH